MTFAASAQTFALAWLGLAVAVVARTGMPEPNSPISVRMRR